MNTPEQAIKRVSAGPVFSFLFASGWFAIIAYNVVSNPRISRIDLAISQWFYNHAAAPLTTAMVIITNLHRPIGIIIISLVGVGLLFRAKNWRWVWIVTLAVPGGLILNTVLKNIFQRARPVFEAPLMTVNSYSFPSGHVMGSTVFYGLLTAFIFSKTTNWRWRTLAVLGAGVMIALVAFSRVYLGVHYVSDTLGALAEGVVWLSLFHLLSGGIKRIP